MIRSYSSVLRSMPMCHAQLKMADLRSVAPGSGVYGAAAVPRRVCASDSVGRPSVSATAIATPGQIVLSREVMTISDVFLWLGRLVAAAVTQGRAVRAHDVSQAAQRAAVARRREPDGELFADLERVRADFRDSSARERRGGAGSERPVRRRAVLVLDRHRDRSVRIHELQRAQRAF